MIRWDLKFTVAGYTVLPDPDEAATYAILPREPRFRIGPDGTPVVHGYKYRSAIEREGGKLAGGFLVADVDYSIPEADRQAVIAELQTQVNAAHGGSDGAPQVRLLDPTYTKAAASVQLLDAGGSGTLVEKVQVPSVPALYGGLGLPITVELSPEGATFLQQAMVGGGPVLQVPYVVTIPVAMPDMRVRTWFNAEKLMEFHQHAEIDWSMWGEDDYRETITETFHSSESHGIDIDPGGVTDQAVVAAVTEWARRSLDDAVKRMVLSDIPPATEDDRKVPDGIDNLWRDFSVSKVANYSMEYTQGVVIDIATGFSSATVPALSALVDGRGNPLDPADFWTEIDLDDPFLQTLRVTARANADFANLPLDSVEVSIRYADEQPREFSLTSPDDVAKFEQYTDGRGYDYLYSYQVNYTGESRRYESGELPSSEQVLTVNVGDTGIFDVEVLPGDIDFAQVTRARVVVRYEDATAGITPVEHSVILDKDNPTARVQEVVFVPVDQPYTYEITYTMASGKDFTLAGRPTRARQLYVNDPFSDSRTISVRGFGDFDTRIDTIFLDLRYEDKHNDYTQTTTVALTKGKPFSDWTFPVVDASTGTLTYSGSITFKNGSLPEAIPEQEAPQNTIMVGDVPRDVQVLSDLVDFTAVKLVKVSLRYTDADHGIDTTKDLIVKTGALGPFTWSHPYERGADPTYGVTVQYFLLDGTSRTLGPFPCDDDTLLVPEHTGQVPV